MTKEATTIAGASSDHPFFRYYAQLTHQQNMLQDMVRTGAYYNAVHTNTSDFAGKRIMDVGTGSGILALFAAQANAKEVFAIEASDSAIFAEKLIKANGFDNIVKVVNQKVEDIQPDEIGKVDLIISEPMGFLLLHERMLESFIYAREKFLAPGGKMFPSTGTIFMLPFSDYSAIHEQTQKTSFWKAENFFGVNMTCLKKDATDESYSQALVGAVDMNTAISSKNSPASYQIDFERFAVDKLKEIVVPFEFVISKTAVMHGLFGWFDVDFIGSTRTITLSTSPQEPTTHWHQCRFLLKEPIGVNSGQIVKGQVKFTANKHFSYDVEIVAELEGSKPLICSKSHIKLHDQYYSYLYQPQVQEMNQKYDSSYPVSMV